MDFNLLTFKLIWMLCVRMKM